MEDMKAVPMPPDFFEVESKKGSLFLLEKYLGHLPDDWMDCILFIFKRGIYPVHESACIILDEDESEKAFKLIAKDNVRVFIFSEDKKRVWMVQLHKENIKGEDKVLYVGGENLRKFCDDKNIFYKSMKTEKGQLISGSNLKWLKKIGEDCRDPNNPSSKEHSDEIHKI